MCVRFWLQHPSFPVCGAINLSGSSLTWPTGCFPNLVALRKVLWVPGRDLITSPKHLVLRWPHTDIPICTSCHSLDLLLGAYLYWGIPFHRASCHWLDLPLWYCGHHGNCVQLIFLVTFCCAYTLFSSLELYREEATFDAIQLSYFVHFIFGEFRAVRPRLHKHQGGETGDCEPLLVHIGISIAKVKGNWPLRN